MVLLATLLLVVLYLFFALLVWWLHRLPWHKQDQTIRPLVSVIIAGRNEAEQLPACLAALAQLTYSTEKLEILLVDDASQDHSHSLLAAFAERMPHSRVLTLTRAEKALTGKAGAVLPAIEQSKGEIIFITDADCQVPPSWIESHLHFFTPEVGMVGGLTLLEPEPTDAGLFQQVQSLDWIYLQTVASASARLGKPLSWMGNNLAFRRLAYDQVGGYRALEHGLIEDFSLLNAISRQSAWRIVLHTEPAAIVKSRPEKNWRRWYWQRKRWALGIRPVRLIGKLLMLVTFLTHMLVLWYAVSWQPTGWMVLLAILLGDTIILYTGVKKFDQNQWLKGIPGFELYYFFYILVMPALFCLKKKIVWKNEVYSA